MSRAQVRKTLADWVADGNIPNLNKIHLTYPKRIDFKQNAIAGQMSRCQGVVFIAGEQETRIALGGAHNGWKRVDYTVIIALYHHSLERDAEDAMADFDSIVDGIKDRLRSDHNFGDTTGKLVWQGAEPEITCRYGEPSSVEGTATETFAEIEFAVTEMIQA